MRQVIKSLRLTLSGRRKMSSNAKRAKTVNGRPAGKARKGKKIEGTDPFGHLYFTGARGQLIEEFKSTRRVVEFTNHGEWMQALWEFLHKKDPNIQFEDLVYWTQKHEWISTFGEGEKRTRQPWTPQFETLPDDANGKEYKQLPVLKEDSSLRYLAPDEDSDDELKEIEMFISEQLNKANIKSDSGSGYSSGSEQPIEPVQTSSTAELCQFVRSVDLSPINSSCPGEVQTTNSPSSSNPNPTIEAPVTAKNASDANLIQLPTPTTQATTLPSGASDDIGMQGLQFGVAQTHSHPASISSSESYQQQTLMDMDPLPADAYKNTSPFLAYMYQSSCGPRKMPNAAAETTSPATETAAVGLGFHAANQGQYHQDSARLVFNSPEIFSNKEPVFSFRKTIFTAPEPSTHISTSTEPVAGTSSSYYQSRSLPYGYQPLLCDSANNEEDDVLIIRTGNNTPAPEANNIVETSGDRDDQQEEEEEEEEVQIQMALEAITIIDQLRCFCKVLKITSGFEPVETLANLFQEYNRNKLIGTLKKPVQQQPPAEN